VHLFVFLHVSLRLMLCLSNTRVNCAKLVCARSNHVLDGRGFRPPKEEGQFSAENVPAPRNVPPIMYSCAVGAAHLVQTAQRPAADDGVPVFHNYRISSMGKFFLRQCCQIPYSRLSRLTNLSASGYTRTLRTVKNIYISTDILWRVFHILKK